MSFHLGYKVGIGGNIVYAVGAFMNKEFNEA